MKYFIEEMVNAGGRSHRLSAPLLASPLMLKIKSKYEVSMALSLGILC